MNSLIWLQAFMSREKYNLYLYYVSSKNWEPGTCWCQRQLYVEGGRLESCEIYDKLHLELYKRKKNTFLWHTLYIARRLYVLFFINRTLFCILGCLFISLDKGYNLERGTQILNITISVLKVTFFTQNKNDECVSYTIVSTQHQSAGQHF